MSNKDKLREWKEIISRKEENEITIKKLKEIVSEKLYEPNFIDHFAYKASELTDCIELKIAAEKYLKNIKEIRDIFEKVANKYNFELTREICSGGYA